MAQQIGEDTKITLDLKTIGMLAAGIGTIVAMEFDMKDQLVRQTIMSTQEDITEMKEDIKRIEEKIDQLR